VLVSPGCCSMNVTERTPFWLVKDMILRSAHKSITVVGSLSWASGLALNVSEAIKRLLQGER